MSVASPTFINLLENVEPSITSLCSNVFNAENANLIKVSTLVGGTTNKLFRVKGIQSKSQNDQKTVLVRVFGEATSDLIDRDAETYYLHNIHLQYPGMVPEVFCRFANGMIYQYFEGRPLHACELPKHSKNIARHLARWHSIQVNPFDKVAGTAPTLFSRIENWLQQASIFNDKGLPMTLADIRMEVSILRSIIEERSFPVCFCHNDLPSLNIILDEHNNRVHFIDYEYASYNYRGFDIGNHFVEWAGLSLDSSKYPTIAQQKVFIRAYLSDCNDETLVEQLVAEANVFALTSHLLWAIWGIIQANESTIDFDYRNYTYKRLQWYLNMKAGALNLLQN
jgi:ethanolamine kinase